VAVDQFERACDARGLAFDLHLQSCQNSLNRIEPERVFVQNYRSTFHNNAALLFPLFP